MVYYNRIHITMKSKAAIQNTNKNMYLRNTFTNIYKLFYIKMNINKKLNCFKNLWATFKFHFQNYIFYTRKFVPRLKNNHTIYECHTNIFYLKNIFNYIVWSHSTILEIIKFKIITIFCYFEFIAVVSYKPHLMPS